MNILYNVTVKVDHEIHDEWYVWMREIHIPMVMATGKFISSRMLKVMGDDDAHGSTYAFQYLAESMADFEDYRLNFAPALQADTKARYGDKFHAFRTLMEVHL